MARIDDYRAARALAAERLSEQAFAAISERTGLAVPE